MTTNATRLDAKAIDFAVAHRMGVAISIDGDAVVHDLNRPTLGGQGSYATVRRNLTMFFERYKAKTISCRITVSQNNVQFDQAVEHARALGFNDIGLGFAQKQLFGYGDTNKTLEKLNAALGRVEDSLYTAALANSPFRFSLLNDVIETLYRRGGKSLPCRASRGYVGISPDGTVVPCHRYFGSAKKTLGNVFDSKPAADRFASLQESDFLTVDEIPKCSTCWARRLCGGECFEIKDNLSKDGVAQSTLCSLRYSIFRHGISLYLRLLSAGEEVLSRAVREN